MLDESHVSLMLRLSSAMALPGLRTRITGRRPFLYGQCFGRLQTNEDSYETRFTMESNNRSIVSVSTLQELNLCDPRSLILVRITVSKRLSSQ